jgi:hypothetical protein
MTTLIGLGLAVVLLLLPGWPLAADFKLELPVGLQEDAAAQTVEEQANLVEFMKALPGEIDPAVSRPPVLPK